MSRLVFVPYKMGSKSVRELCKSLTGFRPKRVKVDGTYLPYKSHFIINWGNGAVPSWYKKFTALGMSVNNNFLNHPSKTKLASNKLAAFRRMEKGGVSIPEFTTSKKEASEWKEKVTVLARRLLSGHSGAGIELLDKDTKMIDAPLYVKYIKKKYEYRVHVFKGNVIDIQLKRKKLDFEEDDFDAKIRNHKNGWIFCKSNVNPPQDVIDESLKAIEVLGLDFGAVDVIYNGYDKKAYVLEINCAPGLEGSTITSYTDAILKWTGLSKRR